MMNETKKMSAANKLDGNFFCKSIVHTAWISLFYCLTVCTYIRDIGHLKVGWLAVQFRLKLSETLDSGFGASRAHVQNVTANTKRVHLGSWMEELFSARA